MLKAACDALASITRGGTATCWRRRERAVEAGALEAIAVLMNRDRLQDQGPDLGIQRSGCLALANICTGALSRSSKARARQSGAERAIAAAQRAWPDDELVQQAAERFLRTNFLDVDRFDAHAGRCAALPGM